MKYVYMGLILVLLGFVGVCVEGNDEVFIAMPSRKTPDGEFKDIAHPINTETRELIKSNVISAYHKALTEEE